VIPEAVERTTLMDYLRADHDRIEDDVEHLQATVDAELKSTTFCAAKFATRVLS
jgi:hypothetical protein